MLRLFRWRNNIINLGHRVHGNQGSQVIRLQRVKIRQRWLKPRNFVIAAGIYYACYQIYDRAIFGTVNRTLDDVLSEMTDKEKEELEDELEPWFIPFPGTTRQVEPLPYRSTDPEWQAFVKVSKNKKLIESIKKDLTEHACRSAMAHPVLTMKCGKDMKIGKSWLDIQYPYKPPPTFVRKGILIDDHGYFWAEQPVESLAVFQTRRALYPEAVAISLWSFSEALMRQNATAVAKLLGYESKPDTLASMTQAIGKLNQQLKKPPPSQTPPTQIPIPPKSPTPEGTTSDPLSAVDKTPSSTTASEGLGAGARSSDQPRPNAMDTYMIKTTQEHTSGPWQTLKQTLAQKWRPLKDYPPRGSFSVTGLIEIQTSRSIIVLDAWAWWDPQTENFDTRSLIIRLRTVRQRIQSPLRR